MGAGLRIKICVRENRRVELRLAHHSTGPGAATRYIIARRHNAERHHAPTLSAFPGLLAPRLLLKKTNAKSTAGPGLTHGRSPQDGRLMWIRCRGLGEYLCWGKLALIRLAAAHGQITERKYSVARQAIRSSRYSFSDTSVLRPAGKLSAIRTGTFREQAVKAGKFLVVLAFFACVPQRHQSLPSSNEAEPPFSRVNIPVKGGRERLSSPMRVATILIVPKGRKRIRSVFGSVFISITW